MAQDESTVRAVVHIAAVVIAAGGTLVLACAFVAELVRRRRVESRVLDIVDRLLPNRSRRIAVGLVALFSSLASLANPPSAQAETVRDWLTQPATTPTTAAPSPRSDPLSPPTASSAAAPGSTRDWLESPPASTDSTSDPTRVAPRTITPPVPTSDSSRSPQTRSAPAPRATAGTVPSRALGPDHAPAPETTDAIASTPSPAEIVPPLTVVAAATYIVTPGECLWDIAAQALGVNARVAAIDRGWRSIYAANRGLIGNDPNLIQPGLVLALPVLDPNA